MKYEFIGTGNMASAIIGGLVKRDAKIAEDIFIYDINTEKAKEFAESLSLNLCGDISEMGKDSDYLILAVKPHIIENVLESLRENIESNKKIAIVSIAAGKSLDYIGGFLQSPRPVIRVMPNVNALVGESISAICKNDSATEKHRNDVKEIFDAVGETVDIEERLFPAFSAIAGASPAYIYVFTDTLARAGVRAGLDKKTALKISAQAVLGSAKNLAESEKHPWELADTVCSPGGTTIEGLKVLLDKGFESAVMNAIDAVIQKDKSL